MQSPQNSTQNNVAKAMTQSHNKVLEHIFSHAAVDETEQDYLTIGSLAKLCNVTVRTLRYYEEMDLIGPVKRTSGKYRLYNAHSLKRIKAILALQDLNFSLEEILSVLGHYSQSRGYPREEQVCITRRSLETQKNVVDVKLDHIMQFKEELVQRISVLDEVCQACVEKHPKELCPDSCDFINVHN